jgi:Rod binding domain-containing protein
MSESALPPVSDAALPRDVRAGSDADKRAYKAALGFEHVLAGELVRSMTASTPGLSDGPRGDAVTDAMADALTQAGGLGLAQQLYTSTWRSQP